MDSVQYLRSVSLPGLVALALAAPVWAAPTSLGSLYVHARAAEAAGDVREANAGFSALMAQEPGNAMIATRAYRQALSVGDMALAIRAARLLDGQPTLPPDARILFVLEQVKTRDWVKAREATEKLAQDRVFGFLAPYFRAWIALGSGSGEPIALVEGARGMPLASPYYPEQRALLLIALGRSQEAAGSLGPQAAARLPASVKGPEHGLSPLLVQVATDFARQQYIPVGMIMARMATYAAPDNDAGWLVLAELLHRMKRSDLALIALDHVASGGEPGANARILRIALLNDDGQHDAALADALAAVKPANAGSDDWGRVGDLQLILSHPAEAAAAYARALALAEAAHAPPDVLWPILLQQGGALDLAGDWPAAKAALERAYAMAPNEPTVLNQVGYSKIEHREDVDSASAMIAKASNLRPDDPAITDSLGWVLYLQGKPADAVPLLERAAAGEPGEAAINEHLGDAYWTIGRLYEARYAWRAALLTADDKDKARLAAKIDTGLDKATAAP
jgi:tetratricopeptide (TPR) repeat protein